MPQKTVQNRGKLKQQLILDCALELLYTEGPAGITLRAVAAKAGVPASSVSYYFPTLVELVQGAFAHYFDQLIPRMTGNIQRELGGSRDLKILAKALATEVSSRDSRTLLPLYETYLAVARHTELYPEADKAIAQIPIVVKAFLDDLAVPESATLSAAIVGLIEGFGLRRSNGRVEALWGQESLQRSFEMLFESVSKKS
ncbi:TetR/AcrR family transcriptional regulator [Arthrobacter russicus]|uniref:AcrR family transcriptional regulator n=1 Tax=Arthrobacter russicus TaxID=172040 RepID=A0ABU1JBI2_9MICC|nr:TetR family transcriptional regulator [Arthrobacter russicus]MDN5666780.1 TetR family transcriptional regulator [Renibacterium salmoninarum]MDR6269769.1 AcrR family transcriptional regulator [Arthrobacter russicus]